MIPGGLYLADTSALARVGHPAVRAELGRLGRLGLIASCVTVDLEALYSARGPAEYSMIAGQRAIGFTDLPFNQEVARRALALQAELARRSQHRAARVVDLLTAAAAEHHAAVVLHYDPDFDHIAGITGQPTRWVVPSGSAG